MRQPRHLLVIASRSSTGTPLSARTTALGLIERIDANEGVGVLVLVGPPAAGAVGAVGADDVGELTTTELSTRKPAGAHAVSDPKLAALTSASATASAEGCARRWERRAPAVDELIGRA